MITVRVPEDRVTRHVDRGEWERAGVPSGLPHVFRTHAKRWPDKRLVVDRIGSMTYAEVEDAVARVATGLAKLGVGTGDAVMVQLPNWREALVVHLATECLGAVTVPMPPIYRAREIRHIANLTEAKVAVVPGSGPFDLRATYAELRGEMPSLQAIVVVQPDGSAGTAEGATQTYASLLAEARHDLAPFEAASLDPNRVTEIGFTSGSTGAPKGAVHTSNTLLAEHRVWLNAFRLTEKDVLFIPATVGHQIGFTMMRATALVGGTLVFAEKWNPADALAAMEREGVTFTFTTPAFLFDMLSTTKAGPSSASSLRTWVLAGQVVTSALRGEANERLPHVRCAPLFGMTEMGCVIMGDAEAPLEKLTMTGRAQPGVEVDVIDPDEKTVAVDTDGQLAVRCPGLFLTYYKQPDATAASFTRSGFFMTGDQVRRDADGFIMITGRIKDLIKRGGESVSPEEVEEAIARHPKVADVAVVGLPDERLGERVCAFVVTTGGESVTLPEIVEFVKAAGLAKQKWPERLELVSELPRTSIGKVHKATLRAKVATLAKG